MPWGGNRKRNRHMRRNPQAIEQALTAHIDAADITSAVGKRRLLGGDPVLEIVLGGSVKRLNSNLMIERNRNRAQDRDNCNHHKQLYEGKTSLTLAQSVLVGFYRQGTSFQYILLSLSLRERSSAKQMPKV